MTQTIRIPDFIRVPHMQKGIYDIHPLLRGFSEEQGWVIQYNAHIHTPKMICFLLYCAGMPSLTKEQINQLNVYLPIARKIWVVEFREELMKAGIAIPKRLDKALNDMTNYPVRLGDGLMKEELFQKFCLDNND
ncbi:hypothetical protein [Thiomicrorhabdus sp. 6S3-12]|uniref:hypothetical protein n=1 Tax=Thiomicrorhabdus sp. 6S3-12 TaxID=2819681 RepID=UPI001AAC4A2C|nr:hypothetical protein [Thiomicrorhabdus sp. 6S3-12]MBO1924571.1 hypothetical protein [Thiomicrorhabdus sp. 6S3-12]